jgi:hypothetical protein
MNRRRLLILLLVALLAAAVAVVLVRLTRDDGAHVLGGPLLPVEMAEVDGLIVLRDGLEFRLDRQEGIAWTLRGALRDWVDPYALGRNLLKLGDAMGGRVLAGSVPEDRRYEFNGPEGVRLILTTEAGAEVRVAFGATNPVTGHVYASGAGRSACFPVEAATRDLVAGLPQNARLMTVLPAVTTGDLDRIELERAGRRDVFVKDEADWWLVAAGPDDPRLTPLVRAYDRLYADKQRRREDGLLALVDRRWIAELVGSVTGTNVSHLVEPRDAAVYLTDWGLDVPWQRVVLRGEGVDPEPGSDTPDALVVAFGEPLDQNTVPAVRRGNPLLTRRQATAWLEVPVGDLLDVRALDLHPLAGDTLVLENAEGVLARAARDRTRPVRFDGRLQWDSLLAAPKEEQAHAGLRSLVVGLDRLVVLAALPPVDDPRVLRDDERLRLTLIGNDPAFRREWHVGRLDPARVPGGAAALVAEEGPEGPIGLWRPADGRLVQIPAWLLTTARRLTH